MADKQEKIAQLQRAMKRLQARGDTEARGDGDFCSFCGREKGEVERLIAGPSVLICNECIAECNQILMK